METKQKKTMQKHMFFFSLDLLEMFSLRFSCKSFIMESIRRSAAERAREATKHCHFHKRLGVGGEEEERRGGSVSVFYKAAIQADEFHGAFMVLLSLW